MGELWTLIETIQAEAPYLAIGFACGAVTTCAAIWLARR